jgi:hypothetical protein
MKQPGKQPTEFALILSDSSSWQVSIRLRSGQALKRGEGHKGIQTRINHPRKMKNKGNNPGVILAHPGTIDAGKQSRNNPG